ncbi:MAG: HD domain-containing protein [Firmicutes bacterium]|nr:HD domain-containing protein [Bacillota bacterium]
MVIKRSKQLTYDEVKSNPTVITYVRKANENLGAIGFTEHGFRHTDLVATTARRILLELGYSTREAELAAIAGCLHDIGNLIERQHHGITGALIAMNILKDMGMEEKEIADVAAAIGNHDEQYGQPVSNISAALILADKADVHRTRVRNRDFANFDIHDRVNYAAEESDLKLDPEKRIITLELKIDPQISRVMEYFEIFLSRMIICRRAADVLDSRFALIINENQLL